MMDPYIIGPIAGWENIEGALTGDLCKVGDVPAAMSDVLTRLEDKYGKEAGTSFGGYFYDFLWILKMGIEKAGTLDTDQVLVAIENLGEFDTIFGKARWIGKDFYGINHQILYPTFTAEIKNGELTFFGSAESWEIPPPKKEWF